MNTLLLNVLVALLLPAVDAPQAGRSDATIIVGPLPLALVQPVELLEPVEILTRGRAEPHARLWLLVSRPLAVQLPEGDARPRVSTAPPVVPILHVNEHRALLIHRDPQTGACAWLVPRVNLHTALVWHLLMTESSVVFWEQPFWAAEPTLAQIADRAVLITPNDEPRPKSPTYRPDEIAAVEQPAVLRSMDDVKNAAERIAAQGPATQQALRPIAEDAADRRE